MRRVDTACSSCDVVVPNIYVEGTQYGTCPACGAAMEWLPSFGGEIRQDSIEGGILIEHGLCNPDGSPRRYYSRSEIKRECETRGLMQWSEMYSEDRTKDARVHADWLRSGEAQRAKQMRDEARRERRR